MKKFMNIGQGLKKLFIKKELFTFCFQEDITVGIPRVKTKYNFSHIKYALEVAACILVTLCIKYLISFQLKLVYWIKKKCISTRDNIFVFSQGLRPMATNATLVPHLPGMMTAQQPSNTMGQQSLLFHWK